MTGILDRILDNKTCSVCNGRNGIEGMVRKADGETIHVNRPCPVCNPTGALPMLAKSRRSEEADDARESEEHEEHEAYKHVLGEHKYITKPIETIHDEGGVAHTHNGPGGHQVTLSIAHRHGSEWQHSHGSRVLGGGNDPESLDEHLEDMHHTHGEEHESESAAEHRAADTLSMRKDEGKLRRSGMIAGILDFISKARGGKKKDKAKRHGKIKSAAGKAKVKRTMHEWGKGKLRSGSKHGPKVTNQKQAVAIALNQARKVGKSGGIVAAIKDKLFTGNRSFEGAAHLQKLGMSVCPGCHGFGVAGATDSKAQKSDQPCPDCAGSGFKHTRKSAAALSIMDFTKSSRHGDSRDCPKCGGAGLYVMEIGERTLMHCGTCGDDYSYLHHRWNDPTTYIDADVAEKHEHTDGHHISNIEAGDNAEKSAGGYGILDYIGKGKVIPFPDRKKKPKKHDPNEICPACKLPCGGPDDCGCDDDCPIHGVNKKSFATDSGILDVIAKSKAKKKVKKKLKPGFNRFDKKKKAKMAAAGRK